MAHRSGWAWLAWGILGSVAPARAQDAGPDDLPGVDELGPFYPAPSGRNEPSPGPDSPDLTTAPTVDRTLDGSETRSISTPEIGRRTRSPRPPPPPLPPVRVGPTPFSERAPEPPTRTLLHAPAWRLSGERRGVQGLGVPHTPPLWVRPTPSHAPVTAVVDLPFAPHPDDPRWTPPARAGWHWVPGVRRAKAWHPGHWTPLDTPPVVDDLVYVWVPGWWVGGTYLEGFWRPPRRPGFRWVPGRDVAGGHAWGHWAPTDGPDGFAWEPGWFDGDGWVEGFWRPETRPGFAWVAGWFDLDGVHRGGWWEPTEPRPGFVWSPGSWSGEAWVGEAWVPFG